MTPFPNWLPKPVADHARKQLVGGGLDQESEARLKRLCSDASMKNVWKALQRAAPDETLLVEFLGFVLREPRFLPNSREPAPSPAKLRKSFEKIAKRAASLIQELQQLAGKNNPDSGIEELRSALLRIANSPRPQAGTERMLSAKEITTAALTSYEFPGNDTDRRGPIVCLHWLRQAARLAATAPPPPGPRKLAARNAPRTQYIQEVDRFILKRFRKSLPSVVATTITVSLELYRDQVTEDLVRRLRTVKRKPPSRKISTKSRR